MARIVDLQIQVHVDVPEAVLRAIKKQAYEAVILALWQAGEISTRSAASELHLTYYEYLDLLATKRIPVLQGPLNPDGLDEAGRKLAERDK